MKTLVLATLALALLAPAASAAPLSDCGHVGFVDVLPTDVLCYNGYGYCDLWVRGPHGGACSIFPPIA